MTALTPARSGCDYAIPRITIVAYDAAGEVTSLVGSEVAVEFGSGYGSAPRLIVRSDESAPEPALCTWTPGAESSTLDVLLSAEQIDTIGPGQWTGVIKTEGPGTDAVQHNVPTMTLEFEIVRWPVAVG